MRNNRVFELFDKRCIKYRKDSILEPKFFAKKNLYFSDIRNQYNNETLALITRQRIELTSLNFFEEGLIFQSLEPLYYSLLRRWSRYIIRLLLSTSYCMLEPANYKSNKRFKSISIFDHELKSRKKVISEFQYISSHFKGQIEKIDHLFICTNHVKHRSIEIYLADLNLLRQEIPGLNFKFHPNLHISPDFISQFPSINTDLPIELLLPYMSEHSAIYSFNSSVLLYAKIFGFKGRVVLLQGLKVFYSDIIFNAFIKNLKNTYRNTYRQELETLTLPPKSL